MVLTASSAATGPAVLELTPSQGGGCLDVVARGENFEPGTLVTIIADTAPHGDSRTMLGEAGVGDDGTFAFALPAELTAFIHCDDMPPPPAGGYAVTASTGQLTVGAGLREPSATATFSRMLSTVERFAATWARTDHPVEEESVSRTWVWGPGPVSTVVREPYAQSPDGMREVQYFDKARMEINNPGMSPDTLWSVTNGLLVVEMVEGYVQTGDATFDSSPRPAALPVAGDADSPGITYAGIDAFGLRHAPALDEGVMITEMIDESGQVVNQKHLADYGVTSARYVPETDHTVAEVFWDFMTGEGLVYSDGQYVIDNLFENPFYATGYPITEAYWSRVTLNGTEQDVLWQCFERRCLTYTPGNPEGWQVEAGNVGLHYYTWRYGE